MAAKVKGQSLRFWWHAADRRWTNRRCPRVAVGFVAASPLWLRGCGPDLAAALVCRPARRAFNRLGEL